MTPHQVVSLLQNNIIPRSRDIFRSNTNTTRPYEGYIVHNTFEVSRIIQYRNSFLPIIKGQVYRENEGSRIHVKMKLHSVVAGFMLVWMSGVTLALIAVFIKMLVHKKFEPAIFFVLLMLLFGYGLTLGGFKYESNKSKMFLAQLLEANCI
ncbi:hypothetical protein [Flavisolibacter ginsengisoli]|uniref:hypothetical protein n=1 Tax=Flavisolibacter ginsengisoli TaxID=462367 RepID=UPI001114A82C|nr:hypothetical protein [Flavisolibacter ginsengisoli]